MDETRFDALTRAFSGGASRRSLLRTLAGVGAAGLAGAVSGQPTSARRRRKHACASIDDCHPCQTCQPAPGQTKGTCVPIADGSPCGGNCGVCQGGHCQPDSTECDDCQTCDRRTFACRPQCPQDKLCCGLDCCDSGQNCCNDVCCDTGCIIATGECCPKDKFCAGHECCEADEECCGGECVLKCDNGCEHDPDDCACGYPPLGAAFCPTLGICRISKCPRGQTFDPSTCRCECKNGTTCGGKCCAAGQQCCDGTSCCDCASGVTCNGACCPEGSSCVDGECCAEAQVCNDHCCGPGLQCCQNRCYLAPAVECGTGCCENGDHCCNGPQGLGCQPPNYC